MRNAMSEQSKPRPYVVTLEPVTGPFWAPPHRRLARLLKAMLRGYGFRCVSARELEATPPSLPEKRKEQNT